MDNIYKSKIVNKHVPALNNKNPRVNVKEYYKRVAEITGLSEHEVSKLNNFRFNTVNLLIKGLYKQRIHFRDFINISFNKKRVDLMLKKGIIDDLFLDLKDKLIK